MELTRRRGACVDRFLPPELGYARAPSRSSASVREPGGRVIKCAVALDEGEWLAPYT